MCAELEAKRPRSRVFNAACSAPEKTGVGELKIPVFPDREVSEFAALDLEIDHARAARYRVEEVSVVTLDSILEQANSPTIDLLTIDVEGTELDVLRGFSIQRHRPRLILLEDRMVYLHKHLFLKHNGYTLVLRTGFDNWYIPCEEMCGLSSFNERLRLFKKLYVGLLFRKIKESMKMRNLRPFTAL